MLIFLLFSVYGQDDEEIPFLSEAEEAKIEDNLSSKNSQEPEQAISTQNWQFYLQFSYDKLVPCILLIIYLLFYIFGKRSMMKDITRFEKELIPELRKYFAVVPNHFRMIKYGTFQIYITGRSCYNGLHISLRFPRKCDPFFFLFDLIFHHKIQITFEYVIEPYMASAAAFYMSTKNSIPFHLKELKLETFSTNDFKLSFNTDFGPSRDKFISGIMSFMIQNQNCLQTIEMSDLNQKSSKFDGRFITFLDFTLSSHQENRLIPIVDLGVSLADNFVLLTLTPEQYEKNAFVRRELISGGKLPESSDIESKKKAD